MKAVLEDAMVTMDRAEARAKVATYLKAVREQHRKEDQEILNGYRALANGTPVVRLSEIIKSGGLTEGGMPRLAACRSDADWCYGARDGYDGRLKFAPFSLSLRRRVDVIDLGTGFLPTCRQLGHIEQGKSWCSQQHQQWHGKRAFVPPVPPEHRPAHHLRNYVTLFEVDKWEQAPAPPGDPALLKHIGGDLYAVLATWDLTELERAVLSGRRG